MAKPYSGAVYCVNNLAVTISTAVTIIQIKAVVPLWLIRASLTQRGSVTSVQERVQILRLTTASTVTSATPLLYDPGEGAASAVGGAAATGITGTVEGGVGDILVDRGFNVLTGFEWIATTMEMIEVFANTFIALKFPVAPASQTWSAQMVFCET